MAIPKLEYCDLIKPEQGSQQSYLLDERIQPGRALLFHCETWSNIQRAGQDVKLRFWLRVKTGYTCLA